MSVYGLYFTFGKPGTYLLDHPKDYIDRRLPDEFYEGIQSEGDIRTVKCLAVDANGSLFFTWKNEYGEVCSWLSHDLDDVFPGLMELLNEEPWYKCKVTFGPDQGQYCVVCENGRTRWNVDMPDECTYDVRKINMVALGLGGAYVVLYANGEILWACETNYPDLYKILIGSDRGDVVFVAMNPHRRNEFFVALANNTVHIRASAVCVEDVVDVLSRYDELTVISSEVVPSSRQVSTQRGIAGLRNSSRREFLRQIATSAIGGITAAVVSAVVGCSVM